MSVPSLIVYANGSNPIGADDLNTLLRGCSTVAQLRGYVGVTGIQVSVLGYSAPNDGGQGVFYWNAAGGAADDNGVTTIVPTGSTPGAGEWTRISSSGALSGSVAIAGSLSVTGNVGLATSSGTVTVPTAAPGTNTTQAASTAFVQASLVTGAIKSVKVQTFSAGSFTYTPSTGMAYVLVEGVGAGGGGGGANNAAAGGGGGGAAARVLLTAAQVGASVVMTIGAAGAGGTGGNIGGAGGAATTLGAGGAVLNLGGGTGGAGGSSGGNPGGAGGTGTVSSGYVLFNIAGQAGGYSFGAASNYQGGEGGATLFGPGGNNVNTASSSSAGVNATGRGAGGSGAVSNDGSNKNGGNGSDGRLVFLEFCTQ